MNLGAENQNKIYKGRDEKMSDKNSIIPKAEYEEPKMEIICFSHDDVITTSSNGDENQGEWDPQSIDNF